MSPYEIRIIGDPVLKQVANEVTDIDGALVQLCENMVETMYEAQGLGLAAPQIGVQKRLFVYDLHDGAGPQTVVNAKMTESSGEWGYQEGCLSVPGLYWEIVRPKQVHVTGIDLDGNEVSIEADEVEARMFQHELDHLNGVLLVERLDDDQRKEARKAIRQLMMGELLVRPDAAEEPAPRRGLSLR